MEKRKCKECSNFVEGKPLNAISFVCGCGHKWLSLETTNSMKIPGDTVKPHTSTLSTGDLESPTASPFHSFRGARQDV